MLFFRLRQTPAETLSCIFQTPPLTYAHPGPIVHRSESGLVAGPAEIAKRTKNEKLTGLVRPDGEVPQGVAHNVPVHGFQRLIQLDDVRM